MGEALKACMCRFLFMITCFYSPIFSAGKIIILKEKIYSVFSIMFFTLHSVKIILNTYLFLHINGK